MLIGTVEGDVHDLGKNIMIALLVADGYSVIDLGDDVTAERFVENIKKHNPDVVGMSSLLTVALKSTKKIVDAINEAGLRDKVKILIGGGRIDQHAADYIQPDAWTDNAAEGINLCARAKFRKYSFEVARDAKNPLEVLGRLPI